MSDFSTAARPYAKAVFEMARDADRFDDWSARLEFWSSVVGNPEMAQRFNAPGTTAEAKAEMLETVAADHLDDESRNFIRLLADKQRIELLSEIHATYEEMRADADGELEASVTSAFELDDGQRERIAEALSKRLDRKVRLVSEVDESLMGGAVIRAGDLVIDGSLQGRLDRMSQAVAS